MRARVARKERKKKEKKKRKEKTQTRVREEHASRYGSTRSVTRDHRSVVVVVVAVLRFSGPLKSVKKKKKRRREKKRNGVRKKNGVQRDTHARNGERRFEPRRRRGS